MLLREIKMYVETQYLQKKFKLFHVNLTCKGQNIPQLCLVFWCIIQQQKQSNFQTTFKLKADNST